MKRPNRVVGRVRPTIVLKSILILLLMALAVTRFSNMPVVSAKSSWQIWPGLHSNNLFSVFMVGSNDGWAAGIGGLIYYWDGTSWSEAPSPTSSILLSVYMTGSIDGWAVGAGGTIIHWNGVSWNLWVQTPAPTVNNLKSVFMTASNDGWAVGDSGTIVHWNGTIWSKWVQNPQPTTSTLQSVFMASLINGWAVGYSGTILHWDGTSWSKWMQTPAPTTYILNSVFMTNSVEGWAVGDVGTTLRWDGSSWNTVTSPTKKWLSSVFAVASNDVWAVGDSGTIIHWDGSIWSTVASPTTAHLLNSIYMVTSEDGWIVSTSEVLHYVTPPTLSAFTTTKPTIDGIIGGSEWASAVGVKIGPFTTGTQTITGYVIMMNDRSNLYIAVSLVGDNDLGLDDWVSIYFDNDHGMKGYHKLGDDGLTAQLIPILGDWFFDGAIYKLDTDAFPAGTLDGFAAAFRYDPAQTNQFEISHPLNSADDAHDFSLSSGQTVGFAVELGIDGIVYKLSAYGLGNYPDTSTYANYLVAYKPPSLPETPSYIMNSPQDDVYFIYADPDRMVLTQGAPREAAFAAYDATASGIIYGLCGNRQVVCYDSNSSLVVAKQPPSSPPSNYGQVLLSGKSIVVMGGPVPNWVVDYYERTGQSPLKLYRGTGELGFQTQSGAIAYKISSTTDFEHNDIFVVEVFQDTNGNFVMIIYGLDWKGTFAGGVYFKEMIKPNLSIYTGGVYVFKWIDGSAGNPVDGVPQKGEITKAYEMSSSLSNVGIAGSLMMDPYVENVHTIDGDKISSSGILAAPSLPARALSEVSTQILSASTNNVYFVYADPNRMVLTPSAPREAAFAAYDATASGIIYGLCANEQKICYDSDASMVVPKEPSSSPPSNYGQVLVSGKSVVVMGGPVPNWVVDYYERTGESSLKLYRGTGQLGFQTQGGTVAYQIPTTTDFEHNDLFVVETFQDTNGNFIMIIYGLNWKGTFAGGLYFKEVIKPSLANYPANAYVYQWIDGSAGNPYDGVPQIGEITPVYP